MSILQYPDSMKVVQQLQVWNNAAFDNGESEDTCAVKVSWSNLEPGPVNQSLESDGSKENQSPLCSMNVTQSSKEQFSAKLENGVGKKRDEKKIDMEIEEIEKEITRLSLKLESLRLEKAEYSARRISMRGRTVPAKCVGQKQSTKNFERTKKFEDPLFTSPKTKFNQRAVSLGPMEIFSTIKSRHVKQDNINNTPVQSIQSRRKPCFFKLQDIEEGKIKTKGCEGKSSSLSPKFRRTISKAQASKPAATTTIGSKRVVKKEEGVLATIQPKKLFKDGEKSVTTAKKPLKPGRIVASRYNQIGNQSNGNFTVNNARKRSLTGNDKEEESDRHGKRRASCEQIVDYSCKNQKSKSRVKKKWEIPNEEEYTESANKIRDLLPKIRTVSVKLRGGSPRDSGPAKRVVELMGRKSYFSMEEETGDSVCQALSFAEADGRDEE